MTSRHGERNLSDLATISKLLPIKVQVLAEPNQTSPLCNTETAFLALGFQPYLV
jgi:hypothetical protein